MRVLPFTPGAYGGATGFLLGIFLGLLAVERASSNLERPKPGLAVLGDFCLIASCSTIGSLLGAVAGKLKRADHGAAMAAAIAVGFPVLLRLTSWYYGFQLPRSIWQEVAIAAGVGVVIGGTAGFVASRYFK